MKQRTAVRAIIKKDGKHLLVQRANGRASIVGKYELLGGKIDYGEQPEDALRRYLHDDAGLHIQTAALFDAVTYIDHDDRDMQYTVLLYTVTLSQEHHAVRLSENYRRYEWKSVTVLQQDTVTDLTSLLLGIVEQDATHDERTMFYDDKNATKYDAIIYSDGGSRGNPGPSAAGFVIISTTQELLEQGGEYLGITTNSQAEYHGVRLGLEQAREKGLRRIDFRVDNMMVVNQMNGVYKIKNRELWPVYERIKSIMKDFDTVHFSHVKREFNQLADGMVNKTLDQYEQRKG